MSEEENNIEKLIEFGDKEINDPDTDDYRKVYLIIRNAQLRDMLLGSHPIYPVYLPTQNTKTTVKVKDILVDGAAIVTFD